MAAGLYWRAWAPAILDELAHSRSLETSFHLCGRTRSGIAAPNATESPEGTDSARRVTLAATHAVAGPDDS